MVNLEDSLKGVSTTDLCSCGQRYDICGGNHNGNSSFSSSYNIGSSSSYGAGSRKRPPY